MSAYTNPMKFRNRFIGFGPNLIFDGESAEQSSFGDDIPTIALV
jgi:hypothetical protein